MTEAPEKWKSAMVRCRMCGNEHAAVYPVPSLMEDCLECPNCGNTTCEPIEDEPE